MTEGVCRLETDATVVQRRVEDSQMIGPHNLAVAIASAIKSFDASLKGFNLTKTVIEMLQEK